MAEMVIELVQVAKAAIERLKSIYPELEDDAKLLADTVEGETDFTAVMEKLSLLFLDAVALREANSTIVSDLRERGQRYERKAEAYRAMMLDLMGATGQRKLALPTATLSIAKGRARLVIDDEDQLPQGFVKIERIPIKTDISAALAAGDQIPGARLVAAPEHLSIRTK